MSAGDVGPGKGLVNRRRTDRLPPLGGGPGGVPTGPSNREDAKRRFPERIEPPQGSTEPLTIEPRIDTMRVQDGKDFFNDDHHGFW
ncbi:hypothetical protein [Novosphingobium sp. BL-8A]|uniref:hypothetical protein n=1 Tax=Novosphingobium sp. BL-8A TaxID=3127639 RepID=UPI0037565B96